MPASTLPATCACTAGTRASAPHAKTMSARARTGYAKLRPAGAGPVAGRAGGVCEDVGARVDTDRRRRARWSAERDVALHGPSELHEIRVTRLRCQHENGRRRA